VPTSGKAQSHGARRACKAGVIPRTARSSPTSTSGRPAVR
jgi:hypothetical protein